MFFKKSKWYLHFIIDLLVLYVFYAQLQGFLAIHEWASWYAPNNELVAKYNLQYNILLICTVILIVIQIGITIIQKKKINRIKMIEYKK